MMNAGKAVFGGTVCLWAGLILGLSATPVAAQYGPILSGTGPINRSMGGAATGSPLSASGALMWNPASLSGLKRSELDVGAELLFPQTSLSSSVGGGALSGSTNNENAVFALPTIALAFRPEQSPFTYGLGMFAVAGFGLNYPGSAPLTGNPLLQPPPAGFGSLFSQYQVLQIAPALVYEVNEQLSVSFSPLVDIGMAQLDPAVFAAPVAGVYPQGTHSSSSWGGGFSLGAFYKAGNWDFGASYKSQQWFQSYQFNTISGGVPGTAALSLDLPSIVSVGASYKGIDRWLLAADVRYIDFSNTGAFHDSGFTPTGALRGVGMQSIFAVALGAQYQMTDALSLRAGYSWSENPIPSSQASANAASPLILQNSLSLGASYQLTDAFVVSMAYMHSFENSITGPIVLPGGPIPGSSITNTAAADMVLIGATVKFGCPRCQVPCAANNCRPQ